MEFLKSLGIRILKGIQSVVHLNAIANHTKHLYLHYSIQKDCLFDQLTDPCDTIGKPWESMALPNSESKCCKEELPRGQDPISLDIAYYKHIGYKPLYHGLQEASTL